MKVLVATSRTQGARTTDFFDGIDGELVWIPVPCERGELLGAAGTRCARCFLGLGSNAGTTTAMVRDVAWLTMPLYADALRPVFLQGVPEEVVWELACDLSGFASRWRTGTVLERDVDWFTRRSAGAGRSSTVGRMD
jgi:hypothetical protein